jgi:hypothetical protein
MASDTFDTHNSEILSVGLEEGEEGSAARRYAALQYTLPALLNG